MWDWGNAEDVRILFGFAPMGIYMKHQGSLTLTLPGPQAVICLKTLSVRKYLNIHEETSIAWDAHKFYDLSWTYKPFSSTSLLRIGSGKVEDDIHSLTWDRA